MKPQCSGTQILLLARPTRARHRATEVPRQATQEFPASLLPGKNTPLSIAGTCKWHSRIAPSRHSRTFARCPRVWRCDFLQDFMNIFTKKTLVCSDSISIHTDLSHKRGGAERGDIYQLPVFTHRLCLFSLGPLQQPLYGTPLSFQGGALI